MISQTVAHFSPSRYVDQAFPHSDNTGLDARSQNPFLKLGILALFLRELAKWFSCLSRTFILNGAICL